MRERQSISKVCKKLAVFPDLKTAFAIIFSNSSVYNLFSIVRWNYARLNNHYQEYFNNYLVLLRFIFFFCHKGTHFNGGINDTAAYFGLKTTFFLPLLIDKQGVIWGTGTPGTLFLFAKAFALYYQKL